MKKAGKWLAVVLAAGMLTAALPACGPSGEGNGSDVPTVTWYVPKENPTDKQLVMDEINKILEEKIGAHLDIQFIDAGAYDDRMTMLYASGADMDLCFVSNWTNNVITAVQKGALAELDGLIDQYAPKLRESVPEYLYESTKIDRKIYGVPNQQVLFNQQCLVIFNDLAEKYGFDPNTVKTLDDLEPYLQTIKDNEPSIYPYARCTSVPFIDATFESIVPECGARIRVDTPEGEYVKVELIEDTPEYQAAVAKMNDWYQKGFIRQDINSVLNVDSEILAGKYAVTDTTYKPGIEAEWKTKTGRDATIIPLGEPYLPSNAGMATMTALARTSKNQEKAMQLLELVQTDKELFNLISFGIEGKHYTKVDDQYIEPIADSGYNLNAAWMFGNQFNAYLTVGQDADVWEQTKQLNDSALKSPISGFVLNTDSISTELSQITTVRNEYASVDNGTEDQAAYDEMVEKLETAGQRKVIEEIQRQVDEFLGQ